MWHVSSRSGVATLRTAIHFLITYLPNVDHVVYSTFFKNVLLKYKNMLLCFTPKSMVFKQAQLLLLV